MGTTKTDQLWCDECQNTGWVDCYCGGDICVCGEPEQPCPKCQGHCGDDEDFFELDENKG